MMTNLFSIFDPSSSVNGLPLNWLSSLFTIIFILSMYWISHSRISSLLYFLTKKLNSEILNLLSAKGYQVSVFLLPLFFFILLNNSMGLLPFVFTASSHMTLTLSLALPLWMGFYLYGWIFNTIHMLAHLVPAGTPVALMSFMVLIEMLSNIIRPFTLAIRLAANMTAGHLLLTLMSSTVNILTPTSAALIVLSQTLLMILEMAVSMIQAYVFMILMTLYLSEI